MAVAKNCNHHFCSTGKKGAWSVRVVSLNRRGKPSRERVTTTIFRCSKCGFKKEYPDYWERNFIVPGQRDLYRRKVIPRTAAAGR